MAKSQTPNPNLKLARAANRCAAHGKLGSVASAVLRQLNRVLFSCDISVGAQIDPTCNFYHAGLGCVIHADAVVGPECIFFQHVTLGAAWHPSEAGGSTHDAPKIGSGVMLGAGCVVLGGIEVGDRSIIGANAVVTKDVPPDCVVVGVPGKIIKRRNN